jgi:hypothetical protein
MKFKLLRAFSRKHTSWALRGEFSRKEFCCRDMRAFSKSNSEFRDPKHFSVNQQPIRLQTMMVVWCRNDSIFLFFFKTTKQQNSEITILETKSSPSLRNWQYKHATRILDVIMLDYPLKVRAMPGMWVQSVPVTVILWGRMKTEQRNLVIRSIRKYD